MTSAFALLNHRPVAWTKEEWLAARIVPDGAPVSEQTISFVFDTFDESGQPILSGYGAGARDPDVETRLLEFAARHGAVELRVYDDGPLLRHPCCAPVLKVSSRADGSRTERWMSHGYAQLGPEGWSERRLDADGTVLSVDHEWDDVRVGSRARL